MDGGYPHHSDVQDHDPATDFSEASTQTPAASDASINYSLDVAVLCVVCLALSFICWKFAGIVADRCGRRAEETRRHQQQPDSTTPPYFHL